MHKRHHHPDCPVHDSGFVARYQDHDFDACECAAFGSPEPRLMQAYSLACDAPPNVVLQSSLVEMQRKAESVGLTQSEMSYWANRLNDLSHAARESLTDC